MTSDTTTEWCPQCERWVNWDESRAGCAALHRCHAPGCPLAHLFGMIEDEQGKAEGMTEIINDRDGWAVETRD